MTSRHACCSCGQLNLTCAGDPVRISMCHCLACQRRTGSVYGVQARFPRSQITGIDGQSTAFTRTADSGNTITFHFCPRCGSTVYYELSEYPELLAVPVGAFADQHFPPPRFSVYEGRRHCWVPLPGDPDMQHDD